MSESEKKASNNSQRPSSILSVALDYAAAGLSVIPIKCDGSKAPAIPSWKPCQQQISAPEILSAHFSHHVGIAIITGVVSGGLEVLDFDMGELLHPWWSVCPVGLVERLPIVSTPSFGWHVFYRCEEISGNHKIAMAADSKTLIETRCEGGYVVACGSPSECHPSGRPYVQEYGPVLPEIPTITPDERRSLWVAARSFDLGNTLQERITKRQKELSRQTSPRPDTSDTPWDWFDEYGNWMDILEPPGWTSRDGINWTRPGKGFGTSAKINIAANGQEVLTVFSSNAGSLSPSNGHLSFGKFNALVELRFNGDRRAAARFVRSIQGKK